MDKYESILGKILAKINGCSYYAITLGQTIYYSAPKWFVDSRPSWRNHEEQHMVQWKRDGYIKFALKYIYYNIRYGYDKNPYEEECRRAENE